MTAQYLATGAEMLVTPPEVLPRFQSESSGTPSQAFSHRTDLPIILGGTG